MFRRIITSAALVLAILTPILASGAEMEGTIRSVDSSERTVTLDNGTKVWLPDGVAVDLMKAGDEIKVSYEERDGRPTAITVEVK